MKVGKKTQEKNVLCACLGTRERMLYENLDSEPTTCPSWPLAHVIAVRTVHSLHLPLTLPCSVEPAQTLLQAFLS